MESGLFLSPAGGREAKMVSPRNKSIRRVLTSRNFHSRRTGTIDPLQGVSIFRVPPDPQLFSEKDPVEVAGGGGEDSSAVVVLPDPAFFRTLQECFGCALSDGC